MRAPGSQAERAPGGAAWHVIWDWNGTLLDDARAVIAATTAAFLQTGIAVTVTEEIYRRNFTRPIKLFYERLLGRAVDAAEWAVLDQAFHGQYGLLQTGCELAVGAAEVLEKIDRRGWTQSVCSMLPHQLLVPAVERQGIAGYFVRIDGMRGGERGGAKLEHLALHLGRLKVVPSRTVLIGDTLDDALAARGAGIDCILLDLASGLHEPAAIRGAGVPVATGLSEALDLLGADPAPPRR